MAGKTTKIQLPGLGMVDAVEVEVTESSERWNEIKLADGSTIRTKSVVLTILRVDGRFDDDGNPLYVVKANQIMTTSSPAHLKKGAGETGKSH